MKTLPVPASSLLAGGLLLGLLGDVLMRAGESPGLNVFLWAAAVALVALTVFLRSGATMSREAIVWLATAVTFAGALAWRDSEPLKLLALAAAAAAFAMPALHAGAAWVRGAGIPAYFGALAGAGLRAGFGGFLVLGEVDWGALRSTPDEASRWSRAAAVGRGVLISIPLLLVFGGLFVAADDVFATILTENLRLDFERIAQDLFLIAFFGWITIGYLHGLLTGTRLPELKTLLPRRPSIGMTEIGVALGLLAALFVGFLIVQFRYLFGGSGLVEVTPGLTYAEYARRGFFELLFVAVLMLPLLLAADWLLVRRDERDERRFRTLAGIQIILLLAVMASAVERLRLYLVNYGLTESRFYAGVLLAWLAVVFLWFAGTVLRGRRDGFAFGVLVSAFVGLGGLHVANPDAIVARTNLARAEAGYRFDPAYLASLSADAAPILIDSFGMLPTDAQCLAAERLLDRWGPDAPHDWRSWSVSIARARTAVSGADARLREAIGPAGRCDAEASVRTSLGD